MGLLHDISVNLISDAIWAIAAVFLYKPIQNTISLFKSIISKKKNYTLTQITTFCQAIFPVMADKFGDNDIFDYRGN